MHCCPLFYLFVGQFSFQGQLTLDTLSSTWWSAPTIMFDGSSKSVLEIYFFGVIRPQKGPLKNKKHSFAWLRRFASLEEPKIAMPASDPVGAHSGIPVLARSPALIVCRSPTTRLRSRLRKRASSGLATKKHFIFFMTSGLW